MKSERPNVLFLFSDQFNARCLSGAGHPDVSTPSLDGLAAGGIRFTNAYAQSPICTPSRVSFLSGLYPSTHGYYGLYGREPAAPMTSLFEYFAEQGYRTGALGKLHTPRYWVERHCQFIYDEFIEYPKYLEGAGLYEQNDNRRFTGWRDGQPSVIPLEHSCEVALAQQTIRFLRNEGEPADRGERDAPWLAWVSFSRPHSPLTPSEPFASMYSPAELSLPPNATPEVLRQLPQRMRKVPGLGRPPELEEARTMLAAYLGLISQVDYGIKLILDEVAATGLGENTIIVFTADHGDYAGEFGLWSKYGGISSRAITRIPMILRLPDGRLAGTVTDEIVEAVDLFPTLCELAGLAVPNHLQGMSFVPLLQPEPRPIRDTALTENAYRKALASKEWRYVANTGEQPDELYNQIEDPWERHNLIDDSRYTSVATDMLRKLLSRLATARRPVTMFNDGRWQHRYDRDGRAVEPLNYEHVDTHI
jgi:arylsulfatase